MKFRFLLCVLCLAFAVPGCGGDDATSSDPQGSASDTTSASEGKPKAPLSAPASKVFLGHYESQGPFATISGRGGDKKPSIKPSGQPAPKKTVFRELKVGSGPPARHGDEVSVYYVGADHKTGKIQFYGWPPLPPGNFRLGYSAFGRTWEKTIEGMKVGGVREVIILAPYLSREPLDYVIVMKARQPNVGD